MYQNQFPLGICPRPHWESLPALPRPLSWNKCEFDVLLRKGEGCREEKGEEEKGEQGKGGKGKKGGKGSGGAACIFKSSLEQPM